MWQLLGHNRGYENNYFENLKYIQEGQLVYYQTKYETKAYKVTEIRKISENDIDVIRNTPENKITLITCIENEPKFRLCVVAEESKEDKQDANNIIEELVKQLNKNSN